MWEWGNTSITLRFWVDMCLTSCKRKFQYGIRASLKMWTNTFPSPWLAIYCLPSSKSRSWLVGCDWGRVLRRTCMLSQQLRADSKTCVYDKPRWHVRAGVENIVPHRTIWDKMHELYEDEIPPPIVLRFWVGMCLISCKAKFPIRWLGHAKRDQAS